MSALLQERGKVRSTSSNRYLLHTFLQKLCTQFVHVSVVNREQNFCVFMSSDSLI